MEASRYGCDSFAPLWLCAKILRASALMVNAPQSGGDANALLEEVMA